MINKKIICIGTIGMFLLTISASISIVKAEFVDQECASGNSNMTTDCVVRPLAQSFTTSVMALTGFEVRLKRSGDTAGFVRIGIKESLDDEKFLNGTVKAISVSSISSTDYKWFKCSFDDEPLSPIILGSEAFIALQLVEIPPDDITIYWSGNDSNPYENGCAYKKPGKDAEWESQDDFDFNFRTYGFNFIGFNVTNNGGTIILDGAEYDQGDTVEHHSGTYTLSANIKPNHEFGSWLARPPNFIKFDDPDSDTTNVTITGHGLIVLCCKNKPPSKPETPNGPSTVYQKQIVIYSTSATDINGDKLKYGWDWDGDGKVEWDNNNENYYSPGETITTSHSWNKLGTYNVKVKARDDDWPNYGESEWSYPFTVTVLNTPPNAPITPDGPTQGCTGVNYEYKTKTSDPNQDKVKYGWDWDGDDNVDEWTKLYLHAPNTYRTITHTFSTDGTYNVQVKAEDEHGNQSDFSSALIVEIRDNDLPYKPTIDGPITGKAGKEYTYTAITTDSDGDQVYYKFDWGDGHLSKWIGPYTSGEEASASHKWTSQGNVEIKVKAKDEWGGESLWSDPLPVSMPKSKSNAVIKSTIMSKTMVNKLNNRMSALGQLLLPFLEQYPQMFPILQHLFGL